jgi:hypothetical protein
MYYCTAENILARYDSVKGWIQINKQPTAEEMKTLLGLGTAAYKNEGDFDAAGSAQAVRDYVGTIPSTATATDVIGYIQEKTAGIATDTALEELTGRVATAEGEIDALQEASAKHVEKVEGKGLSTNDLTNELKGQYDAAYTHSTAAHAPVNAQENVIESVKVNGSALTVTGKAVDITVPTKVSELTNDVPYLVAADIANKADKATTLAGYGITDAYTKSETDNAIATAVGQFVEVSEAEINALFGV